MIHPLFRLIVSDPQLLADHVEAYSDLMADELGAAAKRWKMRAVMNLVFGVSAFVSVIFLGMALMLWAVVPVDNMHSPWALVLVPAIPIVIALWSFMAARAPSEEPGFSAIREQLAADAAMLRSVTAP